MTMFIIISYSKNLVFKIEYRLMQVLLLQYLIWFLEEKCS